MTKQKSPKRAWLMSVISMLMCCAMLIGTTFAWFTDTVTSGKNKIVAGNLDVEMYHGDGTGDEDKVTETTALFLNHDGSEIIWEPGVIAYEKFTVKNVGTLALKYDLSLNVADRNFVTDKDGNETGKSLADVIKVAVVPESEIEGEITREYVQNLELSESFEDVDYDGILLPGEETKEKDGKIIGNADKFAVILYWEPNVKTDDDYNINNGKGVTKVGGDDASAKSLFINFGVNLVATQVPYEEDSFDSNYDAKAEFPSVTEARFPSGTVEMGNDIKGKDLAKEIKEELMNKGIPVKSVVYGNWAEYKDKIGGEFSAGESVNTVGTIRRFYKDGTVYMLTEEAGSGIAAPPDFSSAFSGLSDVTSANLSGLDFSSTQSVGDMFIGCSALTDVNLSGVDFSSIEDASGMFVGCTSLKSVDLSGVNFTDNLTDVSNMFQTCITLTDVKLGDADFSNVTTLSNLFRDCRALQTVDLSGVKTSEKMTTMQWMFYNCNELETVTFGENFDISGVTDFRSMFSKCTSLVTLDLSGFGAPAVTSTDNLQNMFSNCKNLTTIYASEEFDLSDVKTPNATGANIFYNCTKLKGSEETKYVAWGDGPMSTRAHIDGGTSNPGYFTLKP